MEQDVSMLSPADFPEGHEEVLPARTWVFHEGGRADGDVWFVLEGEVHVVLEAPDRRPVIPCVLAAGDMFGDPSFLGSRRRYHAGVRVARPSHLWRVSAAVWSARLQDPAYMRRYLRMLFVRLERMDRGVRRLGVPKAKRRLAMWFLERRQQFGEPMALPHHKVLAMMIGCTRERTTRLLGEMRAAGWLVEEEGGVCVDVEALRNVARQG